MATIKPNQQGQDLSLKDYEKIVENLELKNKELAGYNYINSLADDKTFRMELLVSINDLTNAVRTLTTKVVELAEGKPNEETE